MTQWHIYTQPVKSLELCTFNEKLNTNDFLSNVLEHKVTYIKPVKSHDNEDGYIKI